MYRRLIQFTDLHFCASNHPEVHDLPVESQLQVNCAFSVSASVCTRRFWLHGRMCAETTLPPGCRIPGKDVDRKAVLDQPMWFLEPEPGSIEDGKDCKTVFNPPHGEELDFQYPRSLYGSVSFSVCSPSPPDL